MRTRADSTHGYAKVSGLLFLSLFAAQSGLIALSPVLAEAARDLGVSTAAAGQTRTVSGLVAALVAISVPLLSGRTSLRNQLLAGALLVGLGSLASAAAPSFPVLVLAQIPVGAGVGVLTTSGTLAAAAWVEPAPPCDATPARPALHRRSEAIRLRPSAQPSAR